MVGTLVTSYAIAKAAGIHVNSSLAASSAFMDDCIAKAESHVCEAVDYDLITNYASIAANIKPVIAKACASIAAMDLISYDPTGYLNSENQLILDVLNNNYEKIIGSLKNRQKKFSKLGA